MGSLYRVGGYQDKEKATIPAGAGLLLFFRAFCEDGSAEGLSGGVELLFAEIPLEKPHFVGVVPEAASAVERGHILDEMVL